MRFAEYCCWQPWFPGSVMAVVAQESQTTGAYPPVVIRTETRLVLVERWYR